MNRVFLAVDRMRFKHVKPNVVTGPIFLARHFAAKAAWGCSRTITLLFMSENISYRVGPYQM